MYYVGLDLHKRYVTACALDSAGQVVAAERRLGTTLEARIGAGRDAQETAAVRGDRPSRAGAGAGLRGDAHGCSAGASA